MRDKLLDAFRSHVYGMIAKHVANIEVLLTASVGVAEHPDIIETISKEMELVAKYDEMLEMANKHF